MKIITQDMIKKGYERGIVRLGDVDGETVCFIGDCWFYFGGVLAEENTSEKYKEIVPEEDIVTEIFYTLDSFTDMPEFEDEYIYYYHCLKGKTR